VMAAGATVAAESTEAPAGESLWQKLGGLFAVNRLRYAAFALVLIVGAGITFVVLNRAPRETQLAKADRVEAPSHDSALRVPAENGPTNPSVANPSATSAPASPGLTNGNKSAAADVPRPLLAKEGVPEKSSSVAEARKTEDVAGAPFSPAPPRSVVSREKDATGLASAAPPPAPKKISSDELKPAERANMDESNRGQNMNVQQEQAQMQNETKTKGPNRSRSQQEPVFNNMRRDSRDKAGETQSQKPGGSGGAISSGDDGPSDRKAGGHSFRKQGNAWVDTQYKSSMAVTVIKRGSDAFRGLDSGLQSIANQLGGEVFVVWNGRAYRIR